MDITHPSGCIFLFLHPTDFLPINPKIPSRRDLPKG